MSRFLAVMFDGGGNVPPQLGIVRRLVARGHQVRVLADRGLAPAIAQAGAEVATFARARDVHMSQRDADLVRDWEARTPLEALRRFGEHVIAAQAADHAADVLAEVERFAPDALAVDCFLLGALVGAEKAGVPTASMMHLPCALPLPGVPPFGLPLRRAAGPLGRLRDRVLWAALHRLHDRTVLPRLNGARAALGLPPVRHAFDMVGQATRVLVLTSPAFDPGPSPRPPHVRYVGPQLDDPAWTAPWTPAELPAGDAPLVLVSLGSTFQDQGALVQRVVDALGALPVRGVVTLGNVLTVEEIRTHPNVRVVPSAPHARLLPLVDAVVTHGGHGTVIKALAAGVPVLCIPLGRDQAANAVRVEEAGAGRRLSPRASVRAITRAVRQLIDEPRYCDGAQRLAASIRAEHTADRAVDELEHLARGG